MINTTYQIIGFIQVNNKIVMGEISQIKLNLQYMKSIRLVENKIMGIIVSILKNVSLLFLCLSYVVLYCVILKQTINLII